MGLMLPATETHSATAADFPKVGSTAAAGLFLAWTCNLIGKPYVFRDILKNYPFLGTKAANEPAAVTQTAVAKQHDRPRKVRKPLFFSTGR